MPIENSWYVDKQVICTHAWGDVTADELRGSVTGVLDMYEQSTRILVHQLVDNREVTRSLNAREMASAMPKKAHPRAGWTIMIGEVNPVWKFLTDVIMQVLRLRYRFVKTPEEAIAFLKEVDTSVEWDKADSTLFSCPVAKQKTEAVH